MKNQLTNNKNRANKYIRITTINNLVVYIPRVIYNYISQKDIEDVVKDINYSNNNYSTIYEKKSNENRIFLNGSIFSTFEEAANKLLSKATMNTINCLKLNEHHFEGIVSSMVISCLDKKEEDNMVICIY